MCLLNLRFVVLNKIFQVHLAKNSYMAVKFMMGCITNFSGPAEDWVLSPV